MTMASSSSPSSPLAPFALKEDEEGKGEDDLALLAITEIKLTLLALALTLLALLLLDPLLFTLVCAL